ncbi:hypothetical protein [Gordonia araii]|uniref:hypothetical protein n=1 Tax=Gordonia araii TaxID=263909 RepID=UPI0002F14EBC|nr:hypothetical protein [Gordonia araii]NNG96090.1 hypothetical protein [Gordonia araii NBRC 100433]
MTATRLPVRSRALATVAAVAAIALLPACSPDDDTRSTVTVPSGLEQPSGQLNELLL